MLQPFSFVLFGSIVLQNSLFSYLHHKAQHIFYEWQRKELFFADNAHPGVMVTLEL